MDDDRRSGPARSAGAEVPLDVLPLHSTNLLTVLDEDGIVRYESPAIERIYGYEQDELVGEQVAEYFHPNDREAVVAAFEAVVAGGPEAVEAVEYRHRVADGTYLWVESVASGDPTPDGHYVINTRDVSEQKERERRLRDANERLEEFASIVSHDLRNPLQVAQARLGLAAEECDSAHLADVRTAHDRMESLITDLLAVSTAEEEVSETEPVELARFVETCWETVPTVDATLVVETDRRLRADPNRLRQLLANLFQNAVEQAGTEATVTVGDLATGFYVEDDGPGIPVDDRTEVFEVGVSTTPNGTGLGLSIVDGIVDAHGWRIRITDGTRGGTRFEITGVDPIR
jgi:PAS domain S-box-containing protein